MIGLIDYGCGNIQAFANIYRSLNINHIIVDTENKLDKCDKLILPGVGSFDWAIKNLRSAKFFNNLQHMVTEKNIPILGVCVGMQMMASTSEEGLEVGLGWIPGIVRKFSFSLENNLPLPHMGWNDFIPENNSKLFSKIDKKDFYFLHSYYFQVRNKEHSIGQTSYNNTFCSAVQKDNIYGIQFHPEKSHKQGENILQNFSEL